MLLNCNSCIVLLLWAIFLVVQRACDMTEKSAVMKSLWNCGSPRITATGLTIDCVFPYSLCYDMSSTAFVFRTWSFHIWVAFWMWKHSFQLGGICLSYNLIFQILQSLKMLFMSISRELPWISVKRYRYSVNQDMTL